MSSYMPPMKIKDLIKKVEKSKWILPSFQRKYVWSQEQICDLFDSIMLGYPINTFMIWKIGKEQIKDNNFYTFIQDYQEWWQEIGTEISPKSDDEYFIVIDGQQRINSLYIGLHGSYAEKLPRKRFKKAYDQSIQPKKYLYLNLIEDANEDTQRKYDFRFFSESELSQETDKSKWYKVSDIMFFPQIDKDDIDEKFAEQKCVKTIINKIDNQKKEVAIRKLKRLYTKIFIDEILNYYQDDSSSIEKVVDVFLRSNGGGTPLEFSDLVMSVTIRQWPEFKGKIEELIKLVYSDTGIVINKDFVLKVFLMLYSKDIKFKVNYFEDKTINLVGNVKNNYNHIHELITKTCIFINQIGLDNDTLRSKYSLIPLIYYSYINNFEIDNLSKSPENRRLMEIWLKSALLRGMFGGKPDAVLTKIKNIINDNKNKKFPAKEIFNEFRNKPKDITIDKEFIEEKVNNSHYGTVDANILLTLALKLDPQQIYHVDHLYPKSMFNKTNVRKIVGKNKKMFDYYMNKNNWNTVGNLQLLNERENKSKSKGKLSFWMKHNKKYNWDNYFIPRKNKKDYYSSDNEFKQFAEKRRKLLVEAIYNSLNSI